MANSLLANCWNEILKELERLAKRILVFNERFLAVFVESEIVRIKPHVYDFKCCWIDFWKLKSGC